MAATMSQKNNFSNLDNLSDYFPRKMSNFLNNIMTLIILLNNITHALNQQQI